MKQLSAIQNAVLGLGALLMLAGAAVFPFQHLAACVMFVCGVAMFTAMMFLAGYEGSSFTLKRLRRQQLFSLVCFVIAAVAMAMLTWDIRHGSFMFRFVHHNEWVVFLAIGSLVLLYTSFRIPAELKKEKEGTKPREQR